MPDKTVKRLDVQHYAVITPEGAPIALSIADTKWRAQQNACGDFWQGRSVMGYRCVPVVIVERDTYDRLARELAAYKQAVRETVGGQNKVCCGGGVYNSFDEPPECCGDPIDDADRIERCVAELMREGGADTGS